MRRFRCHVPGQQGSRQTTPGRFSGRSGSRLSGLGLAGGGRFCTKRFCQALEMPSAPQNTQKPRKLRFAGLVLGTPLTTSHFGPPDSIRRRVERPLSRGGGLAQLFRAGQTGRKAIYQAVWPLPEGQGEAGGGQIFQETRHTRLGKCASAPQNWLATQKIADLEVSYLRGLPLVLKGALSGRQSGACSGPPWPHSKGVSGGPWKRSKKGLSQPSRLTTVRKRFYQTCEGGGEV